VYTNVLHGVSANALSALYKGRRIGGGNQHRTLTSDSISVSFALLRFRRFCCSRKGAMHLLLHRVCGNKPGFAASLLNRFLPHSAAFAPSANSLIASSVGDKGGVLVQCAQLDRNSRASFFEIARAHLHSRVSGLAKHREVLRRRNCDSGGRSFQSLRNQHQYTERNPKR
jgi:hypothetical protein